MNKVKRILKWVLISLGGLTVFLLLLIAGADRFLGSERGARWLYSKVDQPLAIKFTPDEVRYLQIGDTTKTPLLLIHGAPGGLFDWLAIAKQDRLYEQYYLLIPERPGYGGTRPKRAEPSVTAQGQALLPILRAQSKPVVVVGHSYGAPVAVTLGALAPERIQHIYGISGAYDPELEVTFGISYCINFQFFRYLLPSPIWVSNVEKLGHPQALREALPLFQSVKVPTTLIHGTADTLVPFENSTYLQALLPTQTPLIALPGQEHPVHVMLPDYFVSLLLGEEPVAPDAQE
ncbi:alpha/beta fold hydrolase [Phaeodactylibacter xiamenensis]|uniref:alpha/beta fold hydrolase n=1 Tax=Phaeodactylibacter xiamenensis TaxID=1524460 RepID=UPI0024A8B274|nr:alpha/beta fold hydrolase [Phaeodactylibacter xiamenensis]